MGGGGIKLASVVSVLPGVGSWLGGLLRGGEDLSAARATVLWMWGWLHGCMLNVLD